MADGPGPCQEEGVAMGKVTPGGGVNVTRNVVTTTRHDNLTNTVVMQERGGIDRRKSVGRTVADVDRTFRTIEEVHDYIKESENDDAR